MDIKEVSTDVIKTQAQLGRWETINSSEDSRFIELLNRKSNVACTISIDINNVATVEMILRDEANQVKKQLSKEMAASRWHINTAITCFNKAVFNPVLLERKDIPFLVTADADAINELTNSFEFASHDKSVNFGFLREGMTAFEKGVWLIKLHAKTTGDMKPVFERVFGIGSHDDFAHILFADVESKAA